MRNHDCLLSVQINIVLITEACQEWNACAGTANCKAIATKNNTCCPIYIDVQYLDAKEIVTFCQVRCKLSCVCVCVSKFELSRNGEMHRCEKNADDSARFYIVLSHYVLFTYIDVYTHEQSLAGWTCTGVYYVYNAYIYIFIPMYIIPLWIPCPT